MSAEPIELDRAIQAQRSAVRRVAIAQTAEPPAARAKRKRLGLGKPIKVGWLLGPVLLVAWWVIGSATGVIDPRTLPAPWTAIATAGELIADGRLQSNLLVSAGRAAQGLARFIVQ